jgi:hypothetical protein
MEYKGATSAVVPRESGAMADRGIIREYQGFESLILIVPPHSFDFTQDRL